MANQQNRGHCPRCGCEKLAFVTEYHKCIWLRLIRKFISSCFVIYLVVAALMWIGALVPPSSAEVETNATQMSYVMEETNPLAIQTRTEQEEDNTNVFSGLIKNSTTITINLILEMLTWAIVYGTLTVFIHIKESKTHIQAVCNNCLHIWSIN